MLRTLALLTALGAAAAAAPDRCPAGYSVFADQGACYKYIATSKTWDQAKAHCALETAYLAEYSVQVDLDFIWSQCLSQTCWLGGTDRAQEGNWRWDHSNGVVPADWGPGEPNNCCGGEDCLQISPNQPPDPGLNDLGCNAGRQFVCERPTGCPPGQFRANANTCTNCAAGRYQPSISVTGVADCLACAAGKYANNVGRSTACTASCTQRYYCPEGSTSATPFECPAGKYGGSAGLGTASCSGNVAPGHYSLSRAASSAPTGDRGNRCPAGRFGAGGASSTACSGPCQAGYFCPIGAGSATHTACGGANKYCPQGSATASNVPAGSYSTPTSPGTVNTRSGIVTCEAGHYCTGGLRTPCAAGRYHSGTGRSSACTAQCAAGFFCPAGSTVATAEPCGGANRFCIAGSSGPATVSSGHYSTPESNPPDQRTGQAPCAEDEFCSGGVRTKRITFTNMCTSPVAGTNAFADTWTVNENAPGATVTGSSLTYTKLGSNTLTPTLVEVPGSYDAGCPQSTAAMNAMFELSNSVTPGGVGTATVSLKSGAAFNFETCSAYAVRVHLTLTGSSTNPLFSCTVNVAVGDVNDRPTYVFDTRMTGGRFLRELAEDTRVRAVVPAFAANPAADSKINTADEDTAQEVRYEIVDVGNPAHDDFAIGTCSGQLFVNQALSYERTPVYTLTVRVTDNGVPPLSADIDVVVNVLDVNEAPVFENTPYTLRLEENEPVGYVITGSSAIVSASDEDTPAGLTYSMQVLDTDPANPPFELRSDGTIATRAVLDFEAVPDFDLDGERDYRVNLLVTDTPIVPGGITFQVTHPTVITLVDTNDPPMLLDLGTNGNQVFTDHFTPYENIPDLTVVGVIQAADPDGDSIDTMVVQGVGAAAIFRAEMVTATEWNLVKYAGTLDFEATPSYSFTLRMTDDDSVDPRSTDVTITVDVQNVNEVSVVTPGQGRTFAEDATSSDIAAQLLATDPDAGDVLTWAIENAPTAWGVKQDGGLFPNQNSGMLDFETTPAYTVRVRTTDRGVPVPQLTSAWEDVTISITNVNEPPVVTPGQVFEIDENSPSGFAVGTVAFADPDTTDSHDFYHLWGPDLWNVRDSAQPIFTLASNGDLTVAAGLDTYPWHSPLDFEERASEGTDSFTLWVALRDAGVDGPRMFSNETITVRLRDVNEVPLVTQPQARTVREQEPIGTQLGGPVEILDQENSTITCTVQSGAAGSQAYITYDVSATCVVTLATAAPDIADNTVQWELLSVTGEDSMGQQHSGMLNITIAASNSVPTFVPGAPTEGPLTIPEGSTAVIANVDTNTDDTDLAQTLTYQLVASSPAFTSGWFTVDLATGDLAGTPQVDYEALAGETVPYRVQVSVQVQDDGPGQLTAVQTWDIMVTNVNEAPWLNGTAVHTVFSLPETDFPGTVLNAVVGGVAATDPDGDMLTFSLTQDASLFAVSTSSSAGAATGVIAMDNTVVSHEDKGATQPHLLTLTVTDNGSPPLSHSLPITIQVTDVNEPPVLMPTEVFVVNEDTLGPGESPASGRRVDFKVPGSRPPGGKVSSADPDTNDLAVLGSAYYAIVGGVNAAHFTIDNTGVIRVTDGQELDFETYDVYNLDVRVCDTSATVPSPGQLCDTVTYTIEVVDVPDISITSFYLFDSATGRVVPNDPANGVPTDGGDIYVVFNGTDMVRAADVTPAYPVTATLSYTAIPDTALPDTATSDCRMLTQDSVWCKHPEGAGKATWLVTVGTTPADMQIQEDLAGLVVTQHSQPTLTSVVVDGNGDGLPDSPPTLRMGTEGGATLLVTGTNFGPAGNVLASSTILYGPASSFLMQSCVMVTPHTAMRCVASAGYSTQLAFTVRIGGVAGASLPTNVGYLDPNITSVTLAGGGSAPTSGGTRFTVRGHNFGPPGLGLLVGLGDPVADATLDSDNCGASPQDSSLVDYRYAGMACSRDSNSPHRVITCDMPEGSGTDHSVFVRVFLEGSSSPNSIQTSQRSVQALSYMGPTLTSIGGNGVQRADTEGNERMLVRGDNLGRVAPCQGVASAANNLACTGIDDATRGGVNAWAQPHLEYARTADLVALNWTIPDPAPAGLWRSASGCVVTALGVMSCCSAEGTGFDFTFRLTVDGQTTAQEDYLHLPEAAYHVPVVRGYEDATPAAPVGDDDAVVVAPTGVLAEPQSPTVGGQAVRVLGNFFGPSMSTVDNVKYGALVEKEFNVNVADCVMETPHRSLICLTVPGAGADLAWTLTVDGQQSQVPTTDYGIPHISHFDTPTTGASTLGMEPVTIRGMNFGPVATLNVSSRARELADFPVFLDWVRYGPVTGEEYNARDCVVVGHTEVSCVTAPGSGDNLKWTMSVSGQRSEIPDMLWSYAQPVLNGMEVLTSDGGDPTTAGGVRVRLTGLDFASADVETKLRVRITVPYYQHVRTPEFRAYMEQIGYIEVGAPFTVPSEMPEFIELDVTGYTFPTVALPLQEAVDFTLPAGVGENIQVQLVQVPRGLGDESATFSNAMSFDYKEPGAPAGSATPGFRYRTQDLDAVRTLITIRGSSLGRSFGTLFDGFVFVDAEVVTPDRVRVWNHGEISVVHTKLAIAERNASAEAAQAAGTGGSEFVSDAHFHVHIDIFKAIEIAPITETVTTCNPADDYFVDVYNATCNCTVQVLTASCTSVEVPTGNFSAPAATWHTEQEEVQATSPSFSGRVGDTSPAPTQGGVDLQFKAKNIGSDINLMTVYVGENAVMKGAMDGAEPRHAVGRTNLCNVTNIAYDDVAREGTVTCTLPAGQGTANRLAFEWNNKEPNINNASSVEDFVEVAYQTPTVTGVEGTVAAGASAPLQRAFTSYETSIGNPESVLHFTFPTEGGELQLSGMNLGLTGGLAFKEHQQAAGVHAAPQHQFNGLVQDLALGSLSYALATGHSHWGHNVSIPASLNTQPAGMRHLMQYRHCGAVGCPIFDSAVVCGDLATTTLSYGEVCDTTDTVQPAISTNPTFSTIAGRESPTTLSAIDATQMLPVLTMTPPIGAPTTDPPVFVSYSYQGPTLDAAATTALSRTAGGDVLRVVGTNFGPAAARPLSAVSVMVGSLPCPLIRDGADDRVVDSPAVEHRQIQCTMPVGAGLKLPVTVTVGSMTASISAAASLVSYQPPVVTRLSHNSGPTDASNGAGGQLRIFVYGDNFGNNPAQLSLVLRSNPTAVALGRELDLNIDPATVMLYNHTTLSFLLPQGQGDVKILEVVVAGQSTRDSMNVPSGAGWPDDSAPLASFAAQPWGPLLFRFDDPVVTAVEGAVGTRGGVLTLLGANFGVRDCNAERVLGQTLTVAVDLNQVALGLTGACVPDEFCSSHTHTRMQCRVTAGVGAEYDLTLRLGSRLTVLPREFSYLPPRLEDVSPTPARADVGFELTLTGQNFGTAAQSNATVFLGEVECTDARIVQTDTTTLDVIKCNSQIQTVGPKDVNLTVAYQTFAAPASEGWVELNCPEGLYGQVGELCQACPDGGACFNHRDPTESCLERIPNVGCNLYREPISVQGTWKLNTTTAEELCQRDVRVGNFTEACPVMVGCDPPEACAGNNRCGTGYTGDRCGRCALRYYRLDGECVRCPDLGWLFILLFVVGILAVCGLGLLMNRYKVNLAFISIGVDYFQVLGLFARSKVAWPRIIKQVLSMLSIFNLNLDLAAPECASPDLEYHTKWIAIMMLPLIIFSVFFMAYLAKYIFKRWFKNVPAETRNSHLPALVSTSVLMFYLLYLYLTRTTFDMFNCSPTDPDDGFLYLEVVFEKCWESATHQLLFPLACVTLVVYVLAYPAGIYYVLSKNRDTVKIDQILRAKGLGDDKYSSSDRVYAFRKMWNKVYYQFKPGKWYWQPIIVARKFMIAVTSLFFRGTPSFQMALIVLLLFFAYAAQVKQRPYMSTSERRAEVLYHEQKVLEGDPRHMKLNETVKAVDRRMKTRGKKANMDAIKKASERTEGVNAVLDYNTLETVLLTCAILVAMAAVLFESRRLRNGSSPIVREALVWVTLLIIFGSMVYFMTVFVIEVMETVAPEFFAKCCKCCKAKKSTIELEVERGMAGMKASMPTDTSTAINPLLAGTPASAKSLSPEEVEQILELLATGATPTHPQWQAIRTFVLQQRGKVTDTTNEIRGLKKAVTVASAKASLSSKSEDRKKRRPKGKGKSKRNFAQAATRRSTTTGKKAPGISKTSASRIKGQK